MKLFGNKKSSRDHLRTEPEKTIQSSPAVETAPAQKKKKNRGLRRFFLVLLIIVLVFGGVYVYLLQQIRAPERKYTEPTMKPAGKEEAVPEETVPIEPEANENNSSLKKDFYTVLLVGVDESEFNADVIMVAALDAANKTINVVSIPRDTMLDVDWEVKKINGSYGVGKGEENDKEAGIDFLKEQISTIIGFEPEYYMQVSYDGFMRAVDAVGGVTYNVPEPIINEETVPPIHLESGEQLLDGEHALMLVRYRGYRNADLGRINAAQDFLFTAFKQLFSVENLFSIPELIGILSETCSSDLELGEMTWFAMQVSEIGSENITFETIPVTTGEYQGYSYCFAVEDGTLDLVNRTVNPYTYDITSDDVDIIESEE